ncbi:PREDICTED: ovostatin-like [Ficedula albicollis]|uniref:ovostatin-like n=1 Tax=Ficedula albicollis TaxID=59894 RepID=UPI000359F1A3|nr:PREDICTED: ovostatin-like [Ficedula albicollis]XP_005038341.1 PREDICTED: ovostatin-like [Ficedula albicollis]XP_016157395.1 PREDICTED: ovostatin-like [Ficedula albicollis]
MWSRALLCILSLNWLPIVSSETQYVLLVPSVVRSDAPQTACVQLHNLSQPLSLSVVLEYGTAQSTLFEEPVIHNGFFKCSEFKVPPATSDPVAFISFSARGATVDLAERRSVAIQNVDSAVFVQTDKPLYKPGQTVMFRVVTLDTQFRPVQETYPRIIIQDPEENKIFQWLEVTSKHGIVQLSFPLIPEPILGSYQITVETKSGEKEYQFFRVEEYVLPKFEVTTTGPKVISFFDEEVRVNVCALYTYGQPVQGNARINVCQQRFYSPLCEQNWKKTCESVTGLLGKDGCLNTVISIKKFQLYRSYAMMYASLNVESIVTENGTGIQMKAYDYVSVNQENDRVQFRNMDSYYKRGIPYHGEVTVTSMNGEPVANSTVVLELNGDYLASYTTDKNGTAAFSIDTSNFFDPSLKLTVKQAPHECADFIWGIDNEPKASFLVRRFYSRTSSFLKIEPVREELSCGQQRTINVHYVLNREGYHNATHTNFYYVVMTQGKITLSGQKQVSISGASRGTFSITLTVTEKLAPSARLLLYTVHPHGEIVADSSRIHSDICFKNKVRLRFSEKQGLPGSKVGLHLEAAANSFCALRAVQSVLLRSGQELSAQSVYYQLGGGDLYGYYYNGLNLEDGRPQECTPSKTIFSDGLYFEPVNVSRDGDVYRIFRDMGLKVFTNSVLRKPVLCNEDRSDMENPPSHYYDANLKASGESMAVGAGGGFSSVRKYFPETWIWELVSTDSRGEVDVSYTIPDSITEWKASAFCVQDDAGFGISPPASVTAFQPFFVDLTRPYSVTRGEKFNLIANVFNYLDKCVQISAILAQSSDYEAEILSSGGNTATVCANERKTYIWAVSPRKLGEVKFVITAEAKLNTSGAGNSSSPEEKTIYRDTLFQTLLVEPEGIKKELTQSSLICAKGKKISEQVSLSLPRNLVQGSARAYFSVIGDILGTALRNMDNLLHMPYGCGEQNMALFTPNIYALDYLNKTGQLTEEIRVRGTGYLSTGYQKQLSYKHRDGSYSSFGLRDGEGSVWLTAFVYKSLEQAKRYIYIDDNVQSQTLIWLASKQKSDGCFETAGSHFNNALKGGEEAEYSLTAYVVASLLEAGHSAAHPVIRSGMNCLETAFNSGVHNLYNQALLAYVYGLAGREERRQFFLEQLDGAAVRAGGSVHWQRENKPPAEHFSGFHSRAPSAEIEMTSYVLLALLNRTKLTPEDLSYVSRIVYWLIKQQNPYGGFSSTQDTVVALQALAQYGYLTFSKKSLNTVEVHFMETPSKIFQVNDKNRFLLQQASLPTIPGRYSVDVNGTGCVYVQTTLRYNIHLPKKAAGFSLSVRTANVSCTGNFPPKFDLVISASYMGNRNVSNMAIIDVKMLSGFVPEESSLTKLRYENSIVDRVDIKNNHILFYLQKVSQKEISFSLSVEQSLPVSDIKPVPVHIYDYYETDEYALSEYNTPCSPSSN